MIMEVVKGMRAKHFLFPSINFTGDTAIEAYQPYSTSHPK